MEEKADELSLSLRPWLLKKLNTNCYACLQWIDRGSKVFKILWEDKGKPGCEESDKLFSDWAIHKDGDRNSQTFSKRKGRFRDAMRNSNNFEEIKDQNVSNLQSGNFKVFRFLSEEEVRVKKRRRRGNSAESANGSQESPEAMNCSQSTDNSDIQSPFSPESLSSLLEQIDDISKNSQPNSVESLCSVSGPSSQPNDVVFAAMSNSNLNPLSPADLLSFDPLAVAPADEIIMDCTNYEQPSDVGTTQQAIPTQDVPPPDFSDHQQALSQQIPMFKSTEEVMSNLGIDCNLLPLFQLTFEYEKQVIHQTVVDFSKGCLLVHDGSNRNHHLGQWPVVLFPEYTGLNRTIKGALKNIVNGLALQSCAGYYLYGYRFGHGYIFYSNCDTDNSDFVKMEKKNEIVLFSYISYVQEAIAYRSGRRQNRAPCQVMLTFGTQPSSIHSQRPVSVVIEPLEADQLKKAFDLPTEGSCSLQCSEDDSIQQLFETFDNIQDRNRAANRDSLQPGSIR